MAGGERHTRIRAVVALLIVAPVGLALKSYAGPLEWWVNNWGASFAYEVFFILLAFALVPRRRAILAIALWVCAATCALEFLQLWHHPLLEAARSSVIGRSLLGNAFSWRDLPAYPIGSALGWALLRAIAGREDADARN